MRTLAGLTLALLLGVAVGAETLSVDREMLVRDRQTVVRVLDETGLPASGRIVTADYFPNSMVERTDSLGVSDSTGMVRWTPEFAGIVTLGASKDGASTSLSVSVRFPGVPAGAVLVFIAAGVILLGGAGWSFMHLMEHAPTAASEDEDDTA